MNVSLSIEDSNYRQSNWSEVDSNQTYHGNVNDENNEIVSLVIICFGTVITVLTIIGNVITIIAIVTEKRLRKARNIFIINLAVSDILVGVIVAPLSLMSETSGFWTFGKTACDFWVIMDVSCCTASILNLCAISYDRYRAIGHPIDYSRKRSPRRVAVIVCAVWIYSFLISLPPIVGWKEKEFQEKIQCRISQEVGYTIFSTCGAFYLPLLLMTYFYFRIYRTTALRKQQWIRSPGSNHFIGRRKSQEAMFKRFMQKNQIKLSTKCVCGSSDEDNDECEDDTVGEDETVHAGITEISTKQGEFCSKANERTPSIDIEMRDIPKCPRQLSTVTIESTSSSGYSTMSDMTRSSVCSFSSRSMSTDSSTSRPSIVWYPRYSRQISIQSEVFHRQNQIRRLHLKSSIEETTTEEENENDPDVSEKMRQLTSVRLAQLSSRRKLKTLKSKKTPAILQDKRAAKTLGLVVGCFIVCWLPFFVIELLTPLVPPRTFHPTIVKTVLWLGYLNSACNPIIYTFLNKDFRYAFKRINRTHKKESISFL
ncbi:hypothetical protein CHS0354_003515 [Potamilus streckersoni]|uniref:G-protein coupled receptors family 1 profile domain-containing protein n=1 Tax=Potamilus streckersoni TaxID=2493646 RepID=A0AAE0VIC2_9BIVA|nr:hypothetical protein CHS0354_003515 [Potamilus streckersoni]